MVVLFDIICSNAVLTPSRRAPPRGRCVPSCRSFLPWIGREVVARKNNRTIAVHHRATAAVFIIVALRLLTKYVLPISLGLSAFAEFVFET